MKKYYFNIEEIMKLDVTKNEDLLVLCLPSRHIRSQFQTIIYRDKIEFFTKMANKLKKADMDKFLNNQDNIDKLVCAFVISIKNCKRSNTKALRLNYCYLSYDVTFDLGSDEEDDINEEEEIDYYMEFDDFSLDDDKYNDIYQEKSLDLDAETNSLRKVAKKISTFLFTIYKIVIKSPLVLEALNSNLKK